MFDTSWFFKGCTAEGEAALGVLGWYSHVLRNFWVWKGKWPAWGSCFWLEGSMASKLRS